MLVTCIAAASVLLAPAHAAPTAPDDRAITVEPVRDAETAAQIIDTERENLPEPQLNIGMKAPELIIAEWVKGDSVSALDDGKTRVIEFWARWCGPCIRAFPHLSELQEEHADTVQIVGVNIWDPRNPESETVAQTHEGVAQFVEKQGERMGYTVAIEQRGKMSDSWMTPAGRTGIPSAFIVDGKGDIAWIGHPMGLDEPLEKIIAGEWDYQAAAAEYTSALETGYWYQHLVGLLGDKQTAERGYRLAYALLRTPLAEQPGLLNAIAWNILTSEKIPLRDRDAAIAFASVACEHTDWEEPSIIDTLARAYFDKGNTAKAVELQQKALALAGDTPMADDLKATLARYQAAGQD